MTDKLVDALKEARHAMVHAMAALEPSRSEKEAVADEKLSSAIPTIDQALTAHEAANAATGDDVRETILDLQNRIEYRQKLIANNFAANNFITVDIPDLQTLINAALRQGVTLPDLTDKIEAEVLAECQFHGAFDAKRIAKDVAPKIMRIVKGGAE